MSKGGWSIDNVEYVERGCRKGLYKGGRDEVKTWTLECREEVSKGASHREGGLSCDRPVGSLAAIELYHHSILQC